MRVLGFTSSTNSPEGEVYSVGCRILGVPPLKGDEARKKATGIQIIFELLASERPLPTRWWALSRSSRERLPEGSTWILS